MLSDSCSILLRLNADHTRSVQGGHLAQRDSVTVLTDQQIEDLITLPKVVLEKAPASGYREENRNDRCDLRLSDAAGRDLQFSIFIRLHRVFIENFSIGLRYQTGDTKLGTITLVRYNGAHGETIIQPDGHYSRCHIHRITEEEILSGSAEPQEKQRDITNRYTTSDQALRVFFSDTSVRDYYTFFPELLQGRLFDGDC